MPKSAPMPTVRSGDEDRVHYLGPAHAVCNLRAGGQKGNEIKRALFRAGAEPSRDW
jgi:hypothetical protein